MLFQIGEAASYSQDLPMAEKYYGKVYEMDPQYRGTEGNLSWIYFQTEQYEKIGMEEWLIRQYHRRMGEID